MRISFVSANITRSLTKTEFYRRRRRRQLFVCVPLLLLLPIIFAKSATQFGDGQPSEMQASGKKLR